MSDILGQLGIDWKLFLSQLVNFFLILIVLTFFVYKPVLNIIKQRNAKIKEGLDKAEEVNIRLMEVDNIGKKRIKEAENKSIEIIKATEDKAKALDQELTKKVEEKQSRLQKDLEKSYQKQQEEMKEKVLSQASELVKKAIIKTVELKPQDVDDALIKKAVGSIKDE